MGEIADAMLEGSMCQTCGEYLGEGEGFPRFCDGCGPSKSKAQWTRRLKRFGKNTEPFAHSIGGKVIHRMNPATKKSFCQFENNFERQWPIHFFSKREESRLPDCKNCASLAERVKP